LLGNSQLDVGYSKDEKDEDNNIELVVAEFYGGDCPPLTFN
jgi:hypothetical protein